MAHPKVEQERREDLIGGRHSVIMHGVMNIYDSGSIHCNYSQERILTDRM